MLKSKKVVEVKEMNAGKMEYTHEMHEIQDIRMQDAFVQEVGASYDAMMAELSSYDLDEEFDYAY